MQAGQESFRSITRSYYRDAAGALPDAFTVEVALGEDERQKGRMRVFKGRGGKECVSEFRTLERFRGSSRPGAIAAGYAYVECRPLTGRTHQLRVHLAAAGAPILNDPFYGNPDIVLRLSDLKRGYKGREEEKPQHDVGIAVKRIAEDGRAGGGEVDAELVRAAGERPALDVGVARGDRAWARRAAKPLLRA